MCGNAMLDDGVESESSPASWPRTQPGAAGVHAMPLVFRFRLRNQYQLRYAQHRNPDHDWGIPVAGIPRKKIRS